jgi:hypothetical protein
MKPATLALGAVAVGFVVGFVWGQGTRSALPGATQTDYSGGVLTVRVDTAQALSTGLRALLG